MNTNEYKKIPNKVIIKKAAQIILEHPVSSNGACIEVSLAFQSYFSERFNMELSICCGMLTAKDKHVPHTWLEYEGLYIDLTSHKQDSGVWVRPIILKEKTESRRETNDLPDHFIEGFEDTVEIELTREWMYGFLDDQLEKLLYLSDHK